MAKKEKLPAVLTRNELLEKIDKERKELPVRCEKRLSLLKGAILEYEREKAEMSEFTSSVKAVDSLKLSRLAFQPIIATHNEISYTAQEIFGLFNVFMDMATRLNEGFGFIPQIGHFTRFLDVSEAKFKYWRNNGSAEVQEACSKVYDELSTLTADAMMQKKIGEVSGIFVEKTRYDRRDNVEIPKQTIQAQNVVITDSEMLGLISNYKNINKKIGEQ